MLSILLCKTSAVNYLLTTHYQRYIVVFYFVDQSQGSYFVYIMVLNMYIYWNIFHIWTFHFNYFDVITVLVTLTFNSMLYIHSKVPLNVGKENKRPLLIKWWRITSKIHKSNTFIILGHWTLYKVTTGLVISYQANCEVRLKTKRKNCCHIPSCHGSCSNKQTNNSLLLLRLKRKVNQMHSIAGKAKTHLIAPLSKLLDYITV